MILLQTLIGGYTPVCNLSPFQGLIAPDSAHALQGAKVSMGEALATAGPSGHGVRDEHLCKTCGAVNTLAVQSTLLLRRGDVSLARPEHIQ